MRSAPHVLSIAILAVAGVARAEPPAISLIAFKTGDFQTAAKTAAAEGEPDAILFAARANLACAELCAKAERAESLSAALRNAETALTLAPDNIDAKLALAVALGLKAKRMSLPEAFASGYAKRGRKLIDSALRQEPDNAMALAVSGAWHLEVVRRGGPLGAKLYGASAKTGIRSFERAMARAPDDPVIAYQYAAALAALDKSSDTPRIKEALRRAIAAPTNDAVEDAMRGRALAMLAQIGGDSYAQGDAEASTLLPVAAVR